MTYKEWMKLSEEERDSIWEESIEENDRLSRKIEYNAYNIREGLEDLALKVEEWKTWQKLHLK